MKKLVFICLIALLTIVAVSNAEKKDSVAKRSVWTYNPKAIIQPRVALSQDYSGAEISGAPMLRRVRGVISGTGYDNEFSYFAQLGFSPSDVNSGAGLALYDAWADWNFMEGAFVRIGQFKIPYSLSRMMSFTSLAMAERSPAETECNLFRDVGVQLGLSYEIAGMRFENYTSVTGGEGINFEVDDRGYCYSNRFHFLPFGKFSKGNYLTETDFAYEKKPKLLLGFGYSMNNKAIRQNGTKGYVLPHPVDIEALALDLLIKSRGVTLMVETYKINPSQKTVAENIYNPYHEFIILQGTYYAAMLGFSASPVDNIALRYTNLSLDYLIDGFTPEYNVLTWGYKHLFYDGKVIFQADLMRLWNNDFLLEDGVHAVNLHLILIID